MAMYTNNNTKKGSPPFDQYSKQVQEALIKMAKDGVNPNDLFSGGFKSKKLARKYNLNGRLASLIINNDDIKKDYSNYYGKNVDPSAIEKELDNLNSIEKSVVLEALENNQSLSDLKSAYYRKKRQRGDSSYDFYIEAVNSDKVKDIFNNIQFAGYDQNDVKRIIMPTGPEGYDASSETQGKQSESNPFVRNALGLSTNPDIFDENSMFRPSSNNEEETTESQSAAQRNTSGSTTKPETFGDNEETRTTIEPMETIGVEDLAIDISKPKLDIDVEDRKNPTTDDLLTEIKKDKDQPGMYQRLRDANEKAFKGGMLLNAVELGHNIHSYNEARNMNTDVDLDRVSPNSVRVQAPDMYSDARNDIGRMFQSASRKSRMLGGSVNPYDSRPMYDAVNKAAGQQSGINIQAANQEGQLNAMSAARANQINSNNESREEQFKILKEKAKDARLTQDKKMIANTLSKLTQMPMEYEQAKFMLDKYESDEELRKNYQLWQMSKGAVNNTEIVPSNATSTGTSSND